MMDLLYTVKQGGMPVATFNLLRDAMAYIGDRASRGDWRDYKDISLWYDGQAVYVAERDLTHFT